MSNPYDFELLAWVWHVSMINKAQHSAALAALALSMMGSSSNSRIVQWWDTFQLRLEKELASPLPTEELPPHEH